MGDPRQRLEVRLARQLGLLLGLLAVALIQVSLLPRPLGVAPDLVLVGVISWTALRGPADAAVWAFYGGLWLDVLSGRALGVHALALLVVVAVVAVIAQSFDPDNLLLPLSVVMAGTLLFQLLLIATSGGPGHWADFAVVITLPALLWNLVLALPEYLALRWWQRRQQPRYEF